MSNTIYTKITPTITIDKNKYNFVYQITELSTGMKYIGSHGTKKPDPLKALKKYKSSTKDKLFKRKQELNPLNFYYEILSYHSTRDEAINEESRLHFLYDVKCNPKYYNRSNQTPTGFSTNGKVCVKDENGERLLINCDDPRYLSGELKYHLSGKVAVCDKEGNNYLVSIDDPRYLSGELVSILKGKVTVKDKYGNILQVSKDDPRYLSGELVGHTKGFKHSKLTKEKMSSQRQKENNAFFGKAHNDDAKYKMRNQYIIDGKLYIGIQEVVKAIGVSESTVKNRCKSNKFKNWIAIKKRPTRD